MRPHGLIAHLAPTARGRRLVVVALATTLAAVLIGVATFTGTEFEEPDLPPGADGAGQGPVGVAPTGVVPVESIAFEQVGFGTAEPAEIPLEGEEEISFDLDGPCAGVTGAAAEQLIADPARVVLVGGGSKGSVDIRNCDREAVAWSASTQAWVTLAETQGELPPGATFRLLFAVNTQSLPAGEYEFQIGLSRPGGPDTTVDVSGLKLGGFLAPGATPAPVPTIGGLVDPGHSGCAEQCITRAWLRTKPGLADVSLEAATNTPATIAALVDTEAPSYSKAGDPFFTSPTVHLTSDGPRTSWTTTLEPLQPDTLYHIIVAAKDSHGVSYRSGTFRTVEVASGLANQVPGGCTSSCVKTAVLTRAPGGVDVDLEVEGHLALAMRALVDGKPVASSDGFVTAWSTTLDLEPGRNYEIVLEVTDQQGNHQTHQAVVSTPKPAQGHQQLVRVTFHKIRVTNDADNTFFNRRGELTFRFEVNGQLRVDLETGEHKLKAPTTLDLGGRSVVIEDAPDLLPIRVQGRERDNNQPGFCSTGLGLHPQTFGRMLIPKCFEVEWNTAEGPIDLHQPDTAGSLPPCYGFGEGVAGDLCVVLHTDTEDPAFEVYVTIDFLGD